MGNGSFPGLSG